MTYQTALAALGDPTRRRVFETLKFGPQAVGAIARGMPVSRPAVSQHLKVLKEAGLVTDRPNGTRHLYYIDPKGITAIRAWLDQFWGQTLAAFQSEVEFEEKNRKEKRLSKIATVTPVRKTIRVSAPPPRAFEIFTAGMSRWWIKTHSINKSPIKDITMEGKVGGRWFERGEDGSECQWGRVLAWEPPGRLLLAWQITQNWQFDTDFLTEVEVRFIADGTGTIVELEHRDLDRFGAAAEDMWKAFDSPGGWTGLLENFAKEAA